MISAPRLVYRIIGSSQVYIRKILLTQKSCSLQLVHKDEFRSLKVLHNLLKKVCSYVLRTAWYFRKLFIVQFAAHFTLAKILNSLKMLVQSTTSVHKKAPPMVELLYGAGDEARTRDILLGKEAFYHWITPAYLIYFSIIHAKKFFSSIFSNLFLTISLIH